VSERAQRIVIKALVVTERAPNVRRTYLNLCALFEDRGSITAQSLCRELAQHLTNHAQRCVGFWPAASPYSEKRLVARLHRQLERLGQARFADARLAPYERKPTRASERSRGCGAQVLQLLAAAYEVWQSTCVHSRC
jgi:hypothetical protein